MRPAPSALKNRSIRLPYGKWGTSYIRDKKNDLSTFIRRINPIITGFCNYFRFSNAADTFGDLSLICKGLYFFVNNWLIRLTYKEGWTQKQKIVVFKSTSLLRSITLLVLLLVVGFGISALILGEGQKRG